MYDIIIIGAGTAGLTAAIYARRAGKDVLIYEGETYGGQIMTTPEIENYPGFKKISGYEFATNLYEQAIALGAKFEYDQVTSISGSLATGFTVISEFAENQAKTIILATGAKNRHLGLVNEEKLTGRGISYCATCDGAFFKGKTVAVNGGGNTAVEDAIYLSNLCEKVYLIHRREGFRAEQTLIDKARSTSNIEFLTNRTISSLNGVSELESVTLDSTIGEPTAELIIDGLFVAIGQTPSSSFLNGFVELDASGYIVAGEDCKTSVEGVFAAGDGRTKALRQLTTAAADGAISSVNACSCL